MTDKLESGPIGPAYTCDDRDGCVVAARKLVATLRALTEEEGISRIAIRTAHGDPLIEIPLPLGSRFRPPVWMALTSLAAAGERYRVQVRRERAWPRRAPLDGNRPSLGGEVSRSGYGVAAAGTI